MVCGGKWGGIRDEGSIGMIELVGVVKLVKGTCYLLGKLSVWKVPCSIPFVSRQLFAPPPFWSLVPP